MRWPITDHGARPGPLYWEFKCLVCDGMVDAHAPWWYRLYLKLRKRPLHGRCADCERCVWQPDEYCDIEEHERCTRCGHCCESHGSWVKQ